MLTLLSETDFVAKNDDFVKMAKTLADKVLTDGKDGLETASAEAINGLMQTTRRCRQFHLEHTDHAGLHKKNGRRSARFVG